MIQSVKPNKDLAKQIKQYEKIVAKKDKKPVDEWIPLPPNPLLPTCVIVDIDGTLSIRGDRGVYDFKKCGIDTVRHQIKYLLDLINEQNKWIDRQGKTHGLKIFVFSGREDFFKEETNKWLNDNQIPFDKLYMRRGGDKRNDAIVKQEMYDKIIRDKYNVFFVIDDRDRVVKMWRSLGLFVFDVNQTGIIY